MSGFMCGDFGAGRALAPLRTLVDSGLGSSGLTILSGSVDPSAGAGVAASQPALYFRTSGGVGTCYVKVGAANTEWSRMTTENAAATFAGAVAATRFLGGTGTAAAPTYSFTGDDNTGVYAEGADIVSLASGGTRYFRSRAAGVDILNTPLIPMNALQVANDITPTALSAQANDYNPPSLSGATVVRQDATVPVTITGLAGGTDGRLLWFVNISANTITFPHESASSTAANRFSLASGLDVSLLPGAMCMLIYNTTSARWRILA